MRGTTMNKYGRSVLLALAAGTMFAACTTETTVDTLLSEDHTIPPEVPENRLLVTVRGLPSPTLSVIDASGKALEAQAAACYPAMLNAPFGCEVADSGLVVCGCTNPLATEAVPEPTPCGRNDEGQFTPEANLWKCVDVNRGAECTLIAPRPCPIGTPLDSFIVRLPGTESYANLRVIATAGARAFRTIVAEVPRASTVYEQPPIVQAGVIDQTSTALSLLIEAKATASGLGVGGLPAATVAKAREDILALRESNEAVGRYFATIAALDAHAADSGAAVPVFVNPGYNSGYEPAEGGSSALNPEFIAAAPFDYDEDEARGWTCQAGDPTERCAAPAACQAGATIQFVCPGVQERRADGSLAKVRLDWCNCVDGAWSCRDDIERLCPAALAHKTVQSYRCPGAPAGSVAGAFVPECTFQTYCMRMVECTLACAGEDDVATCEERCRTAVPLDDALQAADDLLACADRTGCREAANPLTCLTQEADCAEGLGECQGGIVDAGAPADGELAGEWFCLDHPEAQCVTPEGACDGTPPTLPFVCPPTKPGQIPADYKTVPWCSCELQPNTDTASFDAIVKEAALAFEFAQICFGDTDKTEDSSCFSASDCIVGCAGESGCITACRDAVDRASSTLADTLAGCLDDNDCSGLDWKLCARERCSSLLDSCMDWDGDPATCWGQTCTIRVVFTADFRDGRKDGNCAMLNRYKWTKPGPGPMHFTGGIHVSNTLPLAQAERDAIDQRLGDWTPNIVRMSDDGANGDLEAGDGIWTFVTELPIGLHISYKYTYGPDGNVWTGTEEWPGNARILQIVDANGDHFITRHDNYGDEATNKDLANGNPRAGGTLEWDEDVNGDGLFDTMERPYDVDNNCSLDDWKLLSTTTPLTVECPAR